MNRDMGLQSLDRITQYVVMAYQTVIVMAAFAVVIWAYRFSQAPFLGIFVEHTLVTNGVGPETTSPNWPLYNQGLRFGHQLVAISLLNGDGSIAETIAPKRFDDIAQFFAARGLQPGDTVQVTFRAEDGTEKQYQTDLARFGSDDLTRFFILPYFIGLVYLGVSLWIFGMRRSETAGRAFSILASSVAYIAMGLLDLYTTNYLPHLWLLSLSMAGASLFHLGLVFPQEARVVLRYPFLRYLSYLIGLALAILQYSSLFDASRPTYYAQTWKYSYVFAGLGILFFIGITIYRRFTSASPVVRQQARNILFGAIFGFGPITAWLLSTSLFVMNFNPYAGFLPLVLFPATTGYTVLRYRLLRTDYLIGRGVLYSLLTLLALLGYLLIAVGSSIIFGFAMGPDNPTLIALTAFLSTLLLNPLRARLQEGIDYIFFRGERVHQERLKNFTRELTNAVAQADILRILREQVSVSLLPSHLHIYVFDALGGQYMATADETGQPTSDIRFAANSALAAAMRRERLPVFIDPNHVPDAIRPESGRLALLGTQLFVPMPGRDRLVGWLALGERLSGENYASHDIGFLEALGSQSAVALERAQVVANMERRVHEMNALSRVAQGINITLNFDDILELIYAQTSQIINGSDFHLTLFNKTGQYAYHAFCIESGERLLSQEGTPLYPKTALEQEIILSRRSILTQDYLGQCQVLGVTPPFRGLFAWVGVPLNTGAETIGALSVASRDTSISYTGGQMELLQSIADQTAGAIVKSRLLQETERRAQQLSTLNIITRQLTSTLELQPLLKSILESAVQILNTEAGSLFLVDEQTDELIFRVTVGPVARNLVGQRLPPGTGVVGKAVLTRRPVNVSDVAATSTWNPTPDKQTGFMTRAILAVPMEVKDRVIGVIEIINKKDGNPFTEDDQNLLAAFAGQAAVAIENARLYTLTDQELNARVEELSVMQRIDRELNAGLEVNRAMRITLEWAMRQSRAEAGLIGFIQDQGLYVVADQGYETEVDVYKEDYMPVQHGAVREALETGQPQRSSFEVPDTNRAFLTNAHSQMVIPIRRESKVIGLFLLESSRPEAFQQDALNFLSRLSDHAAIAISNAQLYAEVQQANIAKSEFVSFVAHELKNPMTSIKGYAELLAAGAVGSITDMQSNFLGTIRANIERMKTIVEDLNDNSKIEAGRLRLDFRAVDVNDIVENVVRSTRRQIEEKKQTIQVKVSENLPKVWADRTRIEQIMVNLVSNSHKYTSEGGNIVISAEQSANLWDPQGSSQVVHIAVADNGIGLTPEDQKKIFQKFFRSEDDQARKSPGTGLGLNITKSLIEMQGGRIWFESEFRKGTTFHFTVPVSEN